MFENNNDDEYDSILDRIKDHFDQYKTVYISVGVLVIGLSIGYIIGKNSNLMDRINISNSVSNSTETAIKTLVNSTDNSITNITNFQGRQSKIVQCLETGEIWSSISTAAEEIGVNKSTMSRAVNGAIDDINGCHYRIIGLGADI